MISRLAHHRQAMAREIPFLYFGFKRGSKLAAGEQLVRKTLLEALDRLNVKLVAAKLSVKLWMIGGGCMMLHLDTRESSGDLDVVPRKGDFPTLVRLAEEVAKEMQGDDKPIPADWLNGDFTDQLHTLKVNEADFEPDPRFHWSQMVILFAKPQLMLALKCFSLRPTGFDKADILALLKIVPLKNIDALYDLLDHYGDIEFLADEDMIIIESLFKQARGGQ